MATHVDTAGRGDDFTATASCTALACGYTQTFRLGDDGEFERTVRQAESDAAAHDLAHSEAETVSSEDLDAASGMLTRLAAGTFYSDHAAAVRENIAWHAERARQRRLAADAFDTDNERFGPQT